MSNRTATAVPPVSVCGPLADSWGNHAPSPAVIINPDAHPLDVLAWCMGELQSLRDVVLEITAFSDGLEANELHTIVGHRLAPLPKALEAAHAGFRRIVRGPDANSQGSAA